MTGTVPVFFRDGRDIQPRPFMDKNISYLSYAEQFKVMQDKCLQIAPFEGRFETSVNGLYVSRMNQNSDNVSFVIKPSVLFFVDGFCFSRLGQFTVTTEPGDVAHVRSQMPNQATVRVLPGQTFMVIILFWDLDLLGSLVSMEMHRKPAALEPNMVSLRPRIDRELLPLLIRLLDHAQDDSGDVITTPPVLVDIYQHLLRGPLGYFIKKEMLSIGAMNIIKSISWLNNRYTHDLHVNELAQIADMPLTTFHRYFKWLTSLSPLQYLKTVRLIEARRLMLFYGKSAITSAKDVGYGSSTQFTREYKRLFQRPPHRDMAFTMRFNMPIYQPLALI
jgi:AraC-like DNA-binding protein